MTQTDENTLHPSTLCARDLFVKAARNAFAFYGFPSCPLTDVQIIKMWADHQTADQVYSVGCDVAAGYDFEECRAMFLEQAA